MVKECGKKTISKYGFVEKKILKNATDYNMEKVKKWSNIRLIKRKLVMMFTSKKHMYRTINLYVFLEETIQDSQNIFTGTFRRITVPNLNIFGLLMTKIL